MKETSSDQTLLAACIAGEAGAWDLFVERFAKLVYWSIHRSFEASPLAGRSDLIDDVFQEVFAELVEKGSLNKLRDAGGLRRFLVVMAGYRASNKIRELARAGRKLEPLDAELEFAAPEAEVDPETSELLAGAIAELSPKERFCVEMHYMQQRTHQEIAAVLGMSRDTVNSVMRRSREKIEQKLRKKGLF